MIEGGEMNGLAIWLAWQRIGNPESRRHFVVIKEEIRTSGSLSAHLDLIFSEFPVSAMA